MLSKEEIRHALFAAEEIEYLSRQDDFCLQVMLETADNCCGRTRNDSSSSTAARFA
jgi:hypothetical protein